MNQIKVLTLLTFSALALHAQKPADIPSEDKEAYWKAYAVYNQAQSEFRSSLTDHQKQIISQIEQLGQAVNAADKKVRDDCAAQVGMTLDNDQQKKNNLVCKEKPAPSATPPAEAQK
jgi:hypothetical protein